MKTKLLKIVRKRYEIVKITKYKQEPYFIINDKEDEYNNYEKISSFSEIITRLIEFIKVDYKVTSKKRRTKKEKQWWIK